MSSKLLLDRGIYNNEKLCSNIKTMTIFIWLISKAFFADTEKNGRNWKRGEGFVGVNEAIRKFPEITRQNYRTALQSLNKWQMLTSKSTNQGTEYFILNYDKYQSFEKKPTSKSTSELTSNQPATNHYYELNELDKLYLSDKKFFDYPIENLSEFEFDDYNYVFRRWCAASESKLINIIGLYLTKNKIFPVNRANLNAEVNELMAENQANLSYLVKYDVATIGKKMSFLSNVTYPFKFDDLVGLMKSEANRTKNEVKALVNG